MVRSLLAVSLLLLLSACAGRQGGLYAGARWDDGRRGYHGRGDYGYGPDAPRVEDPARAARSYPVPGPPEDPWGPYVREAAARHAVPERWVREVMRQESGGRVGATSPAGAMGLMQVMPGTYSELRSRYGLGEDPYEPRDNILAGAAYLRAMHERFGAPAFLAAYNAGPERVDAVLAGATVLPDETVGYLARVAPRLGMAAELPLPAPAYAWRRVDAGAYGSGFAVAVDPADRAFDGGGLVTPRAPTGDRTGRGSAGGT